MDEGNRTIIWSDAHTGAVLRAERQFLHNTKITTSRINEKKALDKSKNRNRPSGRHIAQTDMQHQILGYKSVFTTLRFIEISTRPMEHRVSTKIRLDKKGSVQMPYSPGNSDDAQQSTGDCEAARRIKFGLDRHFRPNQTLTYKGNVASSRSKVCDHVTQFGLRPVELLELFPMLGEYFRWFEIGKVMTADDIYDSLEHNLSQCMWIDGLGRQVRIRNMARGDVKNHFEEDITEGDLLMEHSTTLRHHILDIIDNELDSSLFFFDDDGIELPIPVFSSVMPDHPSPFLLHFMLTRGKYETELDFRDSGSIRCSLALAGLVDGDLDNEDNMKQAALDLTRMAVTEVFPILPITLRKLDICVVKCRRLFEAVLLENSIPMTDLPGSILTEILNHKNEQVNQFWKAKKRDQLRAIYETMPMAEGIPTIEDVMETDKLHPIEWDPLEVLERAEEQSQESYDEQMLAMEIGTRAVDKYKIQFGESSQVKGCLVHGSPGAGKTTVQQRNALYAMTQGLRTMMTSLMAIRSIAMGGIHIHKLFALDVSKVSSLRIQLPYIIRYSQYQQTTECQCL